MEFLDNYLIFYIIYFIIGWLLVFCTENHISNSVEIDNLDRLEKRRIKLLALVFWPATIIYLIVRKILCK